ncbi:MAG: S8 family peptidase [Candidatus Aminicenantes bacterium]|nr:S8 family peptidase [Candidatus Aminicenantes bacterium]
MNLVRTANRKRAVAALALLAALAAAAFTVAPQPADGPPYVPGRVLVKFDTGRSPLFAAAFLRSYGLTRLQRVPQTGLYVVEPPSGFTVEQTVTALRANPEVRYAEPDYYVRIHVTPNDEFFGRQYALSNPGDRLALPGSPTGTANADIHATAAWEETTGQPTVVVAVLDTGVDLEHPDLKNKLVSRGRDLVNDDLDASDDQWHGTHIAGIIGAETNNGFGIAGVAWNCKILPVKVLDKTGVGTASQVAIGIIWAADNGAHVINMSFGGDESAESVKDALKYAYTKKVVCIASVGNDGKDVDYPAAYDDYVLAVAATDYTDEWPSYSSPGSEVDVAAPAESVLSLVPTWSVAADDFPYRFRSGTSMAAAHVSGLAALIRSVRPWLTAKDIMNVIRYTADDVNGDKLPGIDKYLGYGRINMERALVPAKLKTGQTTK